MTPAPRRRHVLAKLEETCRRIEKLLSGQNATLADLPLAEPGETPLERLQRFKRLLNDALREIDRGEARRCLACGAELDAVALDEMPWATACGRCPPSGRRAAGETRRET